MPKIKVLVVDDAVVMRRLISEVLGSDPEIEIVGKAANGHIAVQKITQVNPDIITLDIEMPVMDGIETVKEVRKRHPNLPVIMFSTLSMKGASATLEALASGATDYVTKPANIGNVTEGLNVLKNELVPKIKAHFQARGRNRSVETALPGTSPIKGVSKSLPKKNTGPATPPKVLCIGTSTGGPNALSDLFGKIDVRLPVPTLIVQHMPPLFTQMLAERLDKNSPNRFYEGQEGQLVEPGSVYIAPGGKHMEIKQFGDDIRIHLHEGPPENSCRPAVDVLFRSIAKIYGPAILAVVMTGMGNDGYRGSELIFENGGKTLAQDEESSVVWGMPRYIVEANLAEKTLSLSDLPGEILHRLRSPGNILKAV